MLTKLERGACVGSAETRLIVEDCPTCHCLYAIPHSLHRRAKEDSNVYVYCPNGHYWWYTNGLQQQIDELKQKLQAAHKCQAAAQARATSWHDQYRSSERSLSATKGVLTRTKNRIAKGVCPCCKRYFENLAAHMKTKHPKYNQHT